MHLEAQIAAFIGAALLLGAFGLAHQRFPSDFSWYWIAGWSFYVVRFLLDIGGTLFGQSRFIELGTNVAVATSAILILLAVLQLVDWDQPTERQALVLWIALIGWSGMAVVFDFEFLLTYTPIYVAFGVIQLATAYLFYQYLKQYSYSSTPLVVGSMVIWGLHKFDYPILRPVESLAAYGYFLGALLSFTTGLGVMMFLLEDAERKATKERNVAKQRLDEFEELFNNIPDPVYIHDLDGQFLRVNDTAVAIHGYTREEFHSMTPADLVSADHREKVEHRIETVESEESKKFDSTHVTADGTSIDVAVHATKITYQGQPAILGVARDVTERKELEQSLTVVNRILRHDIRSAVNIIQGYAELANQSQERPENSLDTVIRQAERLNKIGEQAQTIEHLLTSRPCQTEAKDISALLESKVASLQATYPNASIETNIQPGISAEVVLRYGIALDNVLENAIIHNDKPIPEVNIEAEATNDHVEIRIADNGPGIPREEIEPIKKGMETALHHTSGLGLWIVYWLTRESDGQMEFADNEPSGTVVTLSVPSAETG